MRRWAFNHLRWGKNIFCLFSLLIFASSVAICVRSYFVQENFGRRWQPIPTRTLTFDVSCSLGAVAMDRFQEDYEPSKRDDSEWDRGQIRPPVTLYCAQTAHQTLNLRCAGIQLFCEANLPIASTAEGERMEMRWSRLVIPLWLFLPFTIPPILWLRRWRRRATRGFPVEVTASTEIRGSHGSTCSLLAVTKATKIATKD